MLHGLFGISDVVELDELVMLLVGSLANLLDLAKGTKGLEQLLVGDRGIEVEDHQRALVDVLVRRVVLGDRVVDVELASTQHLGLQVTHGVLGVANVKVRDHDEAAVLALRVHAADRSVGLEERAQLVVLDVAVDVAHKERARWVLAERVLVGERRVGSRRSHTHIRALHRHRHGDVAVSWCCCFYAARADLDQCGG